ncbi:MAG: hypothetical protein NTX86_03830 [Candidatus Dependentiae bacterium]|nr:hypothetical protein [Candidatus Dependentiae bacterium]
MKIEEMLWIIILMIGCTKFIPGYATTDSASKYTQGLKLKIIQIGTSYGIRLPKALIAYCKFKKSVIAKITEQGLLLMPDDAESDDDDTIEPQIAQGDNKG